MDTAMEFGKVPIGYCDANDNYQGEYVKEIVVMPGFVIVRLIRNLFVR